MWNLVKKRLPKPLDRATGDLTNKRVIVDQTDEMLYTMTVVRHKRILQGWLSFIPTYNSKQQMTYII